MTEKNTNIKKEINIKNNVDMISLVEKKIDFFKDVIQKTIIHVQKNKFLDILGISDVNNLRLFYYCLFYYCLFYLFYFSFYIYYIII